MLELHNKNVQHNDLTINNIVLHWESDGSLEIRLCNWGCGLHTNESVVSLRHAEIKEAKEILK